MVGKFSLCWRRANITSTCKSATAGSCPSDYRPISITPILSEIFECLLAKRLNAFAEVNNLFRSQQFGFHKGLGTCDAVLTISDRVQKALDSGFEARMVRLDFSAAFDRVNHNALIYKLSIGGPFLNILMDFLTDRKQRVVVDGHYGEWRSVISGVPQGSVLSPLLFILYTHMWIGLENQLVAFLWGAWPPLTIETYERGFPTSPLCTGGRYASPNQLLVGKVRKAGITGRRARIF